MPAIVHVNRRLTDVSLHYPYEFESIGDWFFERKPVDFLSDQFVNFNKANLLSIGDFTPLGDDDVPPQVKIKYDADTTFTCQIYGVAVPGKWVTEKNADPALDYETEKAIQLTLSLRLRLEYLQVKQRLRDAAVMTNTTTLAAADRFDNYASPTSLPVTTIQLICDNIGYANQGRKPNRIALTTHVLRAIARSEEYKDLVKYNAIQDAKELQRTMAGQLSILEQLVGVAQGTMRIADHTYNAAAEGQTPSYKAFVGSDMLFAYVEPLGLRKWTCTAGFQWSAYPNSPTSIINVPQYHRGTVPTDEMRAFTVIDPKVIKPELGYLLKGCVDTSNADYGGVLD